MHLVAPQENVVPRIAYRYGAVRALRQTDDIHRLEGLERDHCS
jgi:hypothetical protein